MTIEIDIVEMPIIIGDGVSNVFDVTFPLTNENSLYIHGHTDKNEKFKFKLDLDYTVVIKKDKEGATVFLKRPLSDGWHLYIERRTPIKQKSRFNNQGGYYPESIEHGLDKLTMICQELENKGVDKKELIPIKEAIETISSKADKVHYHDITDVHNLSRSLEEFKDIEQLGRIKDFNVKDKHLKYGIVKDINNNISLSPINEGNGSKGVTSHTELLDCNEEDQHSINAITDLKGTLEAKAAIEHTHAISEVIELTNTLSTKANTEHIHKIEEVTELTEALSKKSNTDHIHKLGEVTDLVDKLDSKMGVFQYSTEEQWTGKSWLHGQKIYTKTFALNTLGGNAVVVYPHNIPNVAAVLKTYGFARVIHSDEWIGLPWFYTGGSTISIYGSRTFFKSVLNGIGFQTDTVHITLEYICTDR